MYARCRNFICEGTGNILVFTHRVFTSPFGLKIDIALIKLRGLTVRHANYYRFSQYTYSIESVCEIMLAVYA